MFNIENPETVYIWDMHGVLLTPGKYTNSSVTDEQIHQLRLQPRGNVLYQVPYNPKQARSFLQLTKDALQSKDNLSKHFAPFELDKDAKNALIDVSSATNSRVMICSSLIADGANALRSYMTNNYIWHYLDKEMPAVIRKTRDIPALAFKIYALELILQLLAQEFQAKRANEELVGSSAIKNGGEKEASTPYDVTFPYRLKIIEDNPNIAIPSSRILSAYNIPHQYYIPLSESTVMMMIDQSIWPASTRAMKNDSYICDPDYTQLREDAGVI